MNKHHVITHFNSIIVGDKKEGKKEYYQSVFVHFLVMQNIHFLLSTIYLPTQDFIIYLLASPKIVMGRQSDHEDASKPDILLFAPDILQKHCSFHRHSTGGPTMLCPCPDAVVMRNGEVLRKEVHLSPGDIIGLGQRYLFIFKDPLALMHKVIQEYRKYCLLVLIN